VPVLRLPGVAVVAGVVASDVPDVVVAVLEDAEAEEDADDERDHQEHEQEAPHVLLSPREHAHRLRLLPALPLYVGDDGKRFCNDGHARLLLLLIGGRLAATARVCRSVSSTVWPCHRIFGKPPKLRERGSNLLASCHARASDQRWTAWTNH
jgi:hypothetical protein